MARTFTWIHLGSTTALDPTEGNDTAENASSLNGRTFGTTADPLFGHIYSATLQGTASSFLTNNSASGGPFRFTTSTGGQPSNYTFDCVVEYNATITYADGTTATVTAVLVQSTSGELFLAPELQGSSDTAAYEAKPIRSVTINSVATSNANLGTDRAVTGFDDGYIDGTSGNDLIDSAYIEPIANGSDKIDNNDAGLSGQSGNDDFIRAGAGNDTVLAGLGHDIVYGGTGNDSLSGGSGNDRLFGEDGNDTLDGGTGNDSLDGGAHDDLLSGGAGNDSLSGGTGNDTLSGGDNNDVLDGGDGADSLDGGTGNDMLFGGAGADQLRGGAGADTIYGGADQDTIYGDIGDVVDGGSDGIDQDVLDLTFWGHKGTNIYYDPANHENGTVEFLDSLGNVIGTMTFTDIERVIACFTPGARIITDRGEVPVEALKLGDRVLTRDNGYQEIRWIGRRDLTLAQVLARPVLAPVRIARGALGGDLPARDLVVSPQHRMMIASPRYEVLFGEAEVLVAAIHLVGRQGITALAPQAVSYIHLMFDHHQIICAEGAWTESYQPGAMALKGKPDPQLAELLALFPGIAQGESYPAARITLKKREMALLDLA